MPPSMTVSRTEMAANQVGAFDTGRAIAAAFVAVLLRLAQALICPLASAPKAFDQRCEGGLVPELRRCGRILAG